MRKPTRPELQESFERLCRLFGVESVGFKPDLITAPIDGPAWDGKERWAMKYKKGLGWMIVRGWKGVGCQFTRWNGYIKGRWNFLMFIEGLEWSARLMIEKRHSLVDSSALPAVLNPG